MSASVHQKNSHKKGFTLVELVVSIAIFVLMTILLVVKYGNFNQGVLLTDLAYDVALALRTAQTYGVSVTNSIAPDGSALFNTYYGVHFAQNNTEVDLFSNGLSSYSGSLYQGKYIVSRSATVSALCTGTGTPAACGAPGSTQTSASSLDIMFKRPDPSAVICGTVASTYTCDTNATYAAVNLSSGGSTRSVIVRSSGQISVEQ